MRPINFYASYLHFPDPSDPISPKDNPTRVPYPPKNDGKDTYNPNDVLEKPGEITYLQPKSWESGNSVEDLLKQFGICVDDCSAS